uniref:Putative glycosyltransferase n=1 Tax=viral metagenome TaxID=1070528 RepID=A0A6M3M9B0_9ZZZZ
MKGKIRITWIQDFNIFGEGSGAEMNDKTMFINGLKRGIDLTLVNPESPLPKNKAIISNYTNFPFSTLNTALDQGAVFFLHDYTFCKWRLFFPGQDKCKICEHALKHLALFEKAKGLIFLSPLHKEVYLEQFPSLKKMPSAIIPSAIDTSLFPVPSTCLKDAALTINTLLSFKGRANIIKYIEEHNELSFTIAGHNPDDISIPKNAKFVGLQKYEDLPKLFAAHEYYVELPKTPQPFNRSCAEARLAGCKIITNNLMGAASYTEFQDRTAFKDIIDAAPKDFWSFIQEVL